MSIGFWVAGGSMIALVAALLVAALWRRSANEAARSADFQVYRDQLGEVERDLARGTIAVEEAARVRVEVQRRLLEADREVGTAEQTAAAPRAATLALSLALLAVLGGTFWLYTQLGVPGYPDLPRAERLAMAEELRANRPSQAEAEKAQPPAPARPLDPDYAKLMQQLREKVAGRPDDLQGHRLLAQNEAGQGNFAAAARAQARVLELLGDKATGVDHAIQADLLIAAVGGYVSPEAETELTEALRRDPANPTARYYSGLLFAQNDRPDLAFRLWRPLLEESAADAPWVAPILAQIEEVAALAGVSYSPPEAKTRGPSADQVAQAAEMTPDERQQMIRGMVEGLAARLAEGGGTGAEWAQLISAYGVLGEKAKAEAAWTQAQQALADKPDDLATARAAAEEAGVAG